MKMLTKEECEKALEVLDCKAHYGCDKGYSQDEELCKICENKDFIEMDVLDQLIKEHFDKNGNVRAIANIVIDEEKMKELINDAIKNILDIQPYKFEELKPNILVWDDKKMDLYHVCEKILNKDGTKILANETNYRLFEENRFYPLTKALQYQVGVD